jgi:mono/diheme cytochrome c family protein
MKSVSWKWALILGGLVMGEGATQAQSLPVVTKTVYDMKKVAEPPTLTADEAQGRKLFVQRCALCHDPLGQPSGVVSGPWLDQTTVTRRGEDHLRKTIMAGIRRMPGWQYTLQPTQVGQVIAYLRTVSPDRRPDAVKGARGAGVDDDLLR